MAKSKPTIRIISGALKGRRLPVLSIDGLRPTGDRLRETLFNWLQFDIAGKKVLDLCAGTGALGFEANSRGAAEVTLVESNRQAVQQLHNIVTDFKLQNLSIVHQRAQDYLQNSHASFDVVFLDPPFCDDILAALSNAVIDKVAPGGYLYREYSAAQEMSLLPDNWQLYRQKIAGQVKIELWKKMNSSHQEL